jgi:hypothetical protein
MPSYFRLSLQQLEQQYQHHQRKDLPAAVRLEVVKKLAEVAI